MAKTTRPPRTAATRPDPAPLATTVEPPVGARIELTPAEAAEQQRLQQALTACRFEVSEAAVAALRATQQRDTVTVRLAALVEQNQTTLREFAVRHGVDVSGAQQWNVEGGGLVRVV